MTADEENHTTADDSPPDVAERAVASTVKRYFDTNDSVSEDVLREALQTAFNGSVVEIDPGSVEIFAVVERPSSDGDAPARDCYAISYSVGLDGRPRLERSYLGPAQE